MQAWKRIEPTTARKVGYRTIVTKTFEMPDGRTQQFDLKEAEGSAAVSVIALTPENKVLVFRQFRPGPECIMDEVPGGGAEESEDLEAAARRELLEETGYKPATMTYLGKCSCDAYTNGWKHSFLALGCVAAEEGHSREPNEQDGELHEISIDQLFANAREGRMTDPQAVLLAYDELMRLNGAAA